MRDPRGGYTSSKPATELNPPPRGPAPGAMKHVGEHGPEWVRFPKGAVIIPHPASRFLRRRGINLKGGPRSWWRQWRTLRAPHHGDR